MATAYKKTITTWTHSWQRTRIPTDSVDIATIASFVDERMTKLYEMESQFKTKTAKLEILSDYQAMIPWVDQAAADEWKTFIIELSNRYNNPCTVEISDYIPS